MLLCDHGFEDFGKVCTSLSALFIDNRQMNDLRLVRVRPSEVSVVKAGYTAEICIGNQKNMNNSSQDSVWGSLIPRGAMYTSVAPDQKARVHRATALTDRGR